jgi:cytochrome c
MKALIAAVGMVGLVLATGPARADSGMDMMKKARCNACHAVDKKLVGPSFQDVAAKYKGQADAPAKLFDKVRAGGSGNWGEIPMTPNGPDKISDENLKAVIQWILSGAPA